MYSTVHCTALKIHSLQRVFKQVLDEKINSNPEVEQIIFMQLLRICWSTVSILRVPSLVLLILHK